MQTRLTATITPLKNNNFEIALFSFRTLKTALRKPRYLCQKFRCQFLFTLGKSLALNIVSKGEKLLTVNYGLNGEYNFLRPHMENRSRLTLMNIRLAPGKMSFATLERGCFGKRVLTHAYATSHACLFTRASFGTLSVLNSSLL